MPRYYVTIASGERAADAVPVIAISDQALVRQILRAVSRELEPPAEPVAPAARERGRVVTAAPQQNAG